MAGRRYWLGLALPGLLLLVAILFARPDLRGWTPADYGAPSARVEPMRPGDAAFAVRDCLPGSIEPYVPAGPEEAGSASLTVLTCRSRTSAAALLAAYLALAAVYPLVLLLRRRHSGPSGK
ncbi:hypothetical protein [Zavarzinia sp.]|uniref:hypothetical protein n=1 Tax=Zavarzinia sp. TaxID=2027920 RepID=UPI003567606A